MSNSFAFTAFIMASSPGRLSLPFAPLIPASSKTLLGGSGMDRWVRLGHGLGSGVGHPLGHALGRGGSGVSRHPFPLKRASKRLKLRNFRRFSDQVGLPSLLAGAIRGQNFTPP